MSRQPRWTQTKSTTPSTRIEVHSRDNLPDTRLFNRLSDKNNHSLPISSVLRDRYWRYPRSLRLLCLCYVKCHVWLSFFSLQCTSRYELKLLWGLDRIKIADHSSLVNQRVYVPVRNIRPTSRKLNRHRNAEKLYAGHLWLKPR